MSTPIPTSNLTGVAPEELEITAGEAAIIGVEAAVLLVNLVLVVYVIVNQEYPPLKIKQIPIVTGHYLSGVIWWIGACASMRLFPQINSPPFLYCDLWTIWIQLVFGIYIWVSLVLIRFWRLYSIIKIRNRFYRSPKGIAAAFFVLWSPTLLYGIFSSAFKVDGPVYVGQVYMCQFETAALYANFAILVVYVALLLFFLVSLRNMKQKYLKEYRETAASFGIVMVCYIAYLVIIALDAHNYLWGKAVCSAIVVIIPASTLYLTVSKHAYYCLVKREEYEREFMSMVKNFSTNTDTKNAQTTTNPGTQDQKTKSPVTSQLELEEVSPA